LHGTGKASKIYKDLTLSGHIPRLENKHRRIRTMRCVTDVSVWLIDKKDLYKLIRDYNFPK